MKIWIGKIIGATIGLFSGGPFGIVIGMIAGHLLDQFIERNVLVTTKPSNNANSSLQMQIQEVFFRTTFRVMGRIAKADGHVSNEEIAAAQNIMSQMGLDGDMRQQAIQFFTEGKDEHFDLGPDLIRLKEALSHQASLSQMFLEIQLSVAYSDGKLSLEERRVLDRICRDLGISAFQFEWIHSRVKAAMAGGWSSSQRSSSDSNRRSSSNGSQSGRGRSSRSEIATAYGVLGVKADISDGDLKKAYRKLMSQHHPDKLVAKGLPAEMMKLAKEKTQNIQTAYDKIRQARKDQ
ncbi:MAG: co-chaperone DjlA [Oleispira antarctica]|uniref:Co-chaperone protein DjlA n=1 Tax=Oleispira antarctica RB-8 TaxID=698738 RepID=R4YKJ7_OLEAN|nr:co-chaperone DjlA [Oleispira antarctica]MBQ0791133.1 co-chaperone DjlA [Oleispira antarctica]CCK75086.1 DnaJ-like protein DjlA (Mucoidy activation protein mucZ) [Oleispira antarctica RB-8]